MRKKILLLFVFSLLILGFFTKTPLLSQENKTGTIKGKVIDAEVKSPLPQVKIRVLNLEREAWTDEDGRFTIKEVPIGHYTLEFSCRFYQTQRKTDVIVKSKQTARIHVELKLASSFREEEEITVTAGYFSTSEKQPTSSSSFSFEEIRRLAVPSGDVSRIVSSLPGVVSVNDMKNALTVRGGSPTENSFYIDNIQVPNINHYPRLGTTSGSLGLLKVDFIRDVHFYSGGFSPLYGDSLSSVMDIRFRKGNPDEHNFQLGLDMMGASVVGEGPLPESVGSWMISARRSYLDLLIQLMGQGVPVEYSDFQGKINLDLSQNNQLSFLGISGIDQSGTDKEDALKDQESYYGGLDTNEYTTGIDWLFMWGSKGYSRTSFSRSFIQYKDTSYHTVTEELMRKGKNTKQSLHLRNINHYRFDKTHEISFGLEWKHLNTHFDYFFSGYTDVLGNSVPSIDRKGSVSDDTYATFLNWTWSPFSSLEINTGFRMDYFSFNQNMTFSPRLSLNYNLSPKISLHGSAGVFIQHLPLTLLHQLEHPYKIKDPLAHHFIIGTHILLNKSTRLTVEAYDKEYYHFPLDPQQPSLFIFDEVFYEGSFREHDHLVSKGRGRAYGIELRIQKKLVEKLYGVVSASYFRTHYQGLDGIWRNRAYDNRFIISSMGGYKFNKQWECSLKWVYAGGYPYTPFDMEASKKVNTGIYEISRINSERLPPYHSLNLRMDKRFYFKGSHLILYLTVWNIFDRENVTSHYWNTIKEEPDQVELWGILPCFGLEFEF